jgi:cation transport regulator ChaB
MNSNAQLNTIAEVDLEPIKVKLMHKETGEGWTRERANAVEFEYRRFLYLMKLFPSEQVAPLFDVDIFWHYHILDTMKYAVDCEQIFGYFLHHVPDSGLRGEDDETVHHQAGARMQELYEATFNEAYIRQEEGHARTAPAETAWCNPTAPKTAWCNPTQATTAWCNPTTPKTAWCNPARATTASRNPTAPKTAWCNPARTTTASCNPTAPKTAWCNPARATTASRNPTAPETAWCNPARATTASRNPTAPKTAWCNPTPATIAWCNPTMPKTAWLQGATAITPRPQAVALNGNIYPELAIAA